MLLLIAGRDIFVREDRESAENEDCTVYVHNLSWQVKWQDLKDHFGQVGTVKRADVFEGGDGRSKGAGLVTFSDPAEAQEAIQTLNDSELKGRLIYVREDRGRATSETKVSSVEKFVKNRSISSTTTIASNRLYVGNLAWEVTWKELKDKFKECGDVIRAVCFIMMMLIKYFFVVTV